MKNTRIDRLEESLQQELEQKSINIVLGSVSYGSNTMILCVEGGFFGTIAEGHQLMEDHPENQYVIFGDHSNAHKISKEI